MAHHHPHRHCRHSSRHHHPHRHSVQLPGEHEEHSASEGSSVHHRIHKHYSHHHSQADSNHHHRHCSPHCQRQTKHQDNHPTARKKIHSKSSVTSSNSSSSTGSSSSASSSSSSSDSSSSDSSSSSNSSSSSKSYSSSSSFSSSSSDSCSSWSSEASLENVPVASQSKQSIRRPQHSQSCMDIPRERKAFEDDEDEVDSMPLLESDSQLEKFLSAKEKSGGTARKARHSNQQCEKGNLMQHKKCKKGQENSTNIRKTKSMEVLSRKTDHSGVGDLNEQELEKRKENAHKNFVKEKMKFSAFLNEITRQVLSPSRLTSLGVTDVHRPSSPGQTSEKSAKPENKQDRKSKITRSQRGSSASSVTSTAHSHISKHSHSSKHSPSDKHSHCRRLSHSRKTSRSNKRSHSKKDFVKEQQHQSIPRHHQNSARCDTSSSSHSKSLTCEIEQGHKDQKKQHIAPNEQHFYSSAHQHSHHTRSPSHHFHSQDYHSPPSCICSPELENTDLNFHSDSNLHTHLESHHHHSPSSHHHHDTHRNTSPHHNFSHSDSHHRSPPPSHHHHGAHRSPSPSHHSGTHHHLPCLESHQHPSHAESHHHHSSSPSHHHHHREHHTSYPHHHSTHTKTSHHHSRPETNHSPPPSAHHSGEHGTKSHHSSHSETHHHQSHPETHHSPPPSAHHIGEHGTKSHHSSHSETHHCQSTINPQHHHSDCESLHPTSNLHHQFHHENSHPHHSHSEFPHNHLSHPDYHHHTSHSEQGHHHVHSDSHNETHQHTHDPTPDHHSPHMFECHHHSKPEPPHFQTVAQNQHYCNDDAESYSQYSHSVIHHHSKSEANHSYSEFKEDNPNDDHPSPLRHSPVGQRSTSPHSNESEISVSFITHDDQSTVSYQGKNNFQKEKDSELERLMMLQEQNEVLHHSLLQTTMRMECMGAEFKTGHQLLDLELQRTRIELTSLMDQFTRLQDNYSCTQQTNHLLEKKLHCVAQSRNEDRERLNQRISELTEQLSAAKTTIQSIETINVTSMLQDALVKHLKSDVPITPLSVAPPPAQFMDSDHYDKVSMTGDDQSLGTLPEEEESDWSEMGEEAQNVVMRGSEGIHGNVSYVQWEQKQGCWEGVHQYEKRNGDTESESGGEENKMYNPSRPLQIPHLKFTVHPETLSIPIADVSLARFKQSPDGIASDGYQITDTRNLSSPIRVLSASLEEIHSIGLQQNQEDHHGQLRSNKSMFDLHHSQAGTSQVSYEDKIVCNWRDANNQSSGKDGMEDLESAQKMLNHFIGESTHL